MTEPLEKHIARSAWSVAGLVREVADTLAGRFAVCTVRGELSGFSRAASGHSYFSLKDADGDSALLRCAMFRRSMSWLNFTPADGQLVELRGRVGVYEPRGELQFIVEAMQRAGAGALYEQFLQAKARLEAQGFFDAARKRAIPAFPRGIGVVTSLAGAALHDVLSTLARRAPHVQVVVYPSPVQGAEAVGGLCAALAEAASRREVDTVIVCRGGGSLEDLWSFNDERVVRAMAAMPMPVISGVGHETDVTLADLTADLRAPTPTAAAEFAAPRRQECLDALAARAEWLTRRMHGRVDADAQRLDRVAMCLLRPRQAVHVQQQRLTQLAQRLASRIPTTLQAQHASLTQRQTELRHAAGQALSGQSHRVAHLATRLHAVDPKQVLSRGYAWLSDGLGQAVTRVHQLAPGDVLSAVLDDGTARVTVSSVTPNTAV